MMRKLTSNLPSSAQARMAWFPFLRFCAVFVCCFAILPGNAHQQKNAITRVLFNENTGNIEVMHRFFIHDAEHAAGLIFGERQTLAESIESRQLFSSYVINRFALGVTYTDGKREELALDYVGEEVDGQFLWVYQEIPAVDNIAAMTIVSMALRDVWSDQSNLVNIERNDKIYSVTFDGSAEVLSVELDT
ncbi:MAG: DUF6702 family protein [Gammaproteobacteria bacterium]